MTSYVEGTLIQGERILYTGHVSLWRHWVLIGAGALLSVVGIGLILLAIAFVQYKATELAITNKRVIAKFGFISRRTIEINIDRVESVQVDQTVMGRIFDFGTLVISGAGDPQAPISGISNPMAFRKAFVEAQEISQAEDDQERVRA